MSATLEKIRRLEQYLASDQSAVDPVMGMTIDKLLAREIAHTQDLKARLGSQISDFEQRYKIESAAFYRRYQAGEMGDNVDFVEWAATVEMLEKAEKHLALLDAAPGM